MTMSSISSSENLSLLLNKMVTHPSVQLLLIFLLAVTLIFSKLSGNGLANYDDAFYAQKAKEILTTKDVITMHYNGRPAFENPPFFIWLIAASYKIFGINEYAAKFPSALMGIATILLVYRFGWFLYNQWTGFFSALILTTTIMFTRFAGRAMMDVTLSFFVTLALFSLMLALSRSNRFFLLWGISVSICILIKSVLGFFPAFISLLFVVIKQRWDIFKSIYMYIGVLIIALFGCSWYYLEYFLHGRTFLDIHFIWLIYQRGFLTEPQPWYEHFSYVKDLFTYYWPWLPFFIWGLWIAVKAFRKENAASLLIVWCATMFIVMSAMQARVMWYILPIIPAASILSGNAVSRFLSEHKKILCAKISIGITIIAIIVINATPIRLSQERETDIRVLAPYVKHFSQHGYTTIGYDYDYYSLNNALMFYSDYAAEPIYRDVSSINQAFASADTVLALIDNAVLFSIGPSLSHYEIVRKCEGMSLISNHTLNISGIKTW